MYHSVRFLPLVVLGGLVGCRDDRPPSPLAARPAFDAAAPPTCPTNPTVTVTDEATLGAAIAAAHPGDVIAVSGTIPITAGDTIRTADVTLTCATPGSGLVAVGSAVQEPVTAAARGIVVTGLVLDGTQAGEAAYLALNDGVTAFAEDVQFTHNAVTCAVFGVGVFFAGGSSPVITDNVLHCDGAISGIQLQANGPDLNAIPLPIRVDGARIERNTVIATGPTRGIVLGAIRPFDARGIVIADNVVGGSWGRDLSATRLQDSRVSGNVFQGASVYGIRTSFAISPEGFVTGNVFTGNVVTGAGVAGVFAQRACANVFVANDFRGNSGGIGLILNDSTGANVVAGVQNGTVIDNGAFDCDGDGGTDPNQVTGGALRGSVASGAASDLVVPPRSHGVTPL